MPPTTTAPAPMKTFFPITGAALSPKRAIPMVTFGFSNFIFAFLYNKLYLDALLEQGYSSVDSEAILGPVEAKLGTKIPRRT